MNSKNIFICLSFFLSAFYASKMVIGHNIADSIKYLYYKRIATIDVDHKESKYKGVINA
jgi:hypothetical protein